MAGPVPETAYSPHKAGGFVPFPDRDRDVLMMPGAPDHQTGSLSSSDGTSSSPPWTPSLNLASSAWPPVVSKPEPVGSPNRTTGVRRTSLGKSPEGFSPGVREAPELAAPRAGPFAARRYADAPARPAAGTVIPLASSRAGELASRDSLDHPGYGGPTPPSVPRIRAPPFSHSPGRSEIPAEAHRRPAKGGFCSECSRRLVDFRSWVECRFCRKPLCHQCLQQSFREDDAGLCSECRDDRRWRSRGGRTPRWDVPGVTEASTV